MSAPSFTEEQLRRDIRPRFARVRARPGIDLANHSLGRPPDRMAEDVAAALDTWYRDLDGAWDFWLEGRERFRSLVARLVGVPRPDCIIPRASAGQGLRAVLNALPGEPRVVTTDGEFDSIAFVLGAYRDRQRIHLKTLPWREFSAEGADLLVLSTVMFQTGEVVTDLARRVADAHRAGARVLLDVYHHAGALPLDLGALDADAFLTVTHAEAARLVAELRTRGIATDARGCHLRLGPDLLNAEAELARAAAELGEVLS